MARTLGSSAVENAATPEVAAALLDQLWPRCGSIHTLAVSLPDTWVRAHQDADPELAALAVTHCNNQDLLAEIGYANPPELVVRALADNPASPPELIDHLARRAIHNPPAPPYRNEWVAQLRPLLLLENLAAIQESHLVSIMCDPGFTPEHLIQLVDATLCGAVRFDLDDLIHHHPRSSSVVELLMSSYWDSFRLTERKADPDSFVATCLYSDARFSAENISRLLAYADPKNSYLLERFITAVADDQSLANVLAHFITSSNVTYSIDPAHLTADTELLDSLIELADQYSLVAFLEGTWCDPPLVPEEHQIPKILTRLTELEVYPTNLAGQLLQEFHLLSPEHQGRLIRQVPHLPRLIATRGAFLAGDADPAAFEAALWLIAFAPPRDPVIVMDQMESHPDVPLADILSAVDRHSAASQSDTSRTS